MKMGWFTGFFAVATAILMTCLLSESQDKRKVIIDQDASGPAGKRPASDPADHTVLTDGGLRHHRG